jgi:hypothetical protein
LRDGFQQEFQCLQYARRILGNEDLQRGHVASVKCGQRIVE